ncbi:MAG: hypothetical protein Ct9H300mP12_08880 [Acidimicrobiales bacterium]|nr:MAG: hypothetical protein Ct9H300mP12_08880 [Acidimicrobiales bacterium]
MHSDAPTQKGDSLRLTPLQFGHQVGVSKWARVIPTRSTAPDSTACLAVAGSMIRVA